MKKKILFLIIFICSLFLFNQNVYADEVELYPYKLDYADVDFNELPKINGMTRVELVDYLLKIFNENVTDDNLGIYIINNKTSVVIRFYSKEKKLYNYYLYNQNNNGFTQDCLTGKISYRAPTLSSSYSSSDFDSMIQTYIDYIKKGVDSSFDSGGCAIIKSGILESSSIDLHFPLYSTVPVYYTNVGSNPSYNSNVPFVYENNVILYNQEIPTYFSSQYSDSKNIKSEIFNYMGFYVYRVPVENINDLRVEFSYDVADEYSSYFNDVDNTLDYLIYARRSEVDYNYFRYTIDSACKVIPNIVKKDNHFSGTFTFDCSKATLLNKYDYFIIDFIQRYSLPISNVNLTTNFGNIFINEITRDPNYVYDSYTLNENDKLLYSSAKDDTILYYSTNLDKSLYISIVDFNNVYSNSIHAFVTSPVGSLEKINYTFGKTNGYGFLAYPYYRPDTINLLFDSDRGYISVSDKNSLSYYFDGSWRTGYRPIANPTTTDSFTDISSYFGVVTNFIDSLSVNINDFSVVLQNIYNLAPTFLQTFIFVVFILSMTYILYELLRK